MSESSGRLTTEKIRESIKYKKRYRDMPTHYESYKEAFKDNFFVESSRAPAIVFAFMMIPILLKKSGSIMGVVADLTFLAVFYALWCAFVSRFYKAKFLTRQTISMLSIVIFALLLWVIISNPIILFFN